MLNEETYNVPGACYAVSNKGLRLVYLILDSLPLGGIEIIYTYIKIEIDEILINWKNI